MFEAKLPLSRRGLIATGVVGTGIALTPTFAQSQCRSPNRQATIRTDDHVITLVNLFALEPAKLPSLLDVLRDGTETFFSKMPGFVSSSVLTARDNSRVINYSQWKSAEDIAAFRKDPRFAPYIKQLQALARLEGMECHVAYVKSA